MSLSTRLADGIVLLRPFQVEDAEQLFEAARESLTDIKPWMSWAHDAYSQEETEGYIRITRARWEEGKRNDIPPPKGSGRGM